jgi:hypothetical protein
VNGTVKVYADALYQQVRSSSGQTVHTDSAEFAHLMASRRSATYQPLSGPEFQSVAKIFADHVSRCIRARFNSYRQAYKDRETTPNDHELREILNDVMTTKDQEISHAATALQQYAQANGLITGTGTGIDPAAIIGHHSAPEHERVVHDWKVWKAMIGLKAEIAQQKPTSKTALQIIRDTLWSWGTIVVAATLLLGVSGNSIYAGDVKGTTILCCLGFGLLTAKFVMWDQTRNLRYRSVANGAAIGIAIFLLVVLVSWAKQRVPTPPPAALITMEVSPSGLPIYIPPHSVTSVLQIHPYIGLTATQDGLFKVANDTGSEGCWPRKEILDTTEPNRYENVYRLRITNHSERTLESGIVKFALKYNTGLTGGGCMPPKNSQPDQNDVVLIPPLDPGRFFEFYAINQSGFCAWLLPPQSTIVKMTGQEKESEVPLVFDKNPLYTVGAPVFSATVVKWEGIPTHSGGYGAVRTGSYACAPPARAHATPIKEGP